MIAKGLFLLPALILGLVASTALPGSEPAAAAAAKSYTVEGVHSSVLFKCKHLDTSWFYGRFNQVRGQLTVDTEAPEKSSVEITIAAESVDTHSDDRDKHLRSPDFLDVKQFPEITFKSTKVARKDERWAVTGDLTLHGVKKSLTVDMEHTGGGQHPMSGKALIGFHGIFTVPRSEYGITYGEGALGEEITILISVEATAQ